MGSPPKEDSNLDRIVDKETEGGVLGTPVILWGGEGVITGTRDSGFILVMVHRNGGELHLPAPVTAVQSRERGRSGRAEGRQSKRHTHTPASRKQEEAVKLGLLRTEQSGGN